MKNSGLMDPGWLQHLELEFKQPYMQQLQQFLQAEKRAGKQIFPPSSQRFNALNSTPLDRVKVVILGQDPYHGPGQAHGLSFSVPTGIKIPPSLLNIYKEIQRDLGLPIAAHGCLQAWARQGVLLLNATLSVEQGNAGSHQKQGWEQFTDQIVGLLNEQRQGLVFMLWGNYAQKKGRVIDANKHCVLKTAHPSPLSVYRGFSGCGHFSAANLFLQEKGQQPIDWSVP